ncbi:ferrichrome iron receptor (plasmid) [Leptolyngbya sp. NIES-3755]|nr:ferrichrome iron receptor [Leptolyngbya sp. NIES-3755]
MDRFFGVLVVTSSLMVTAPVWAEDTATVRGIREIPRSATTIKDFLGQVPAAPIQITGVRLNRTDAGTEVVLETATGAPLQAATEEDGKTLIAELDNAVLALPDGRSFSADNPIAGIVSITVTQQPGNRVEVRVTGDRAVPIVSVRPGSNGLVLAVNAANAEDEEEITVTGQQPSPYRAPRASTATRTDTPLRDIPQSIQVVPQQVLQDQKVFRLNDALRNVSGVFNGNPFGGTLDSFNIRGFNDATTLRDGIRDSIAENGLTLRDFANVEQIEVLKGPASVLYGNVEPGGVINVVTKQPLATPFYGADLSIGSYNFYRPSFDFSGPLTSDRAVRYRLNVAYENAGSFRDFVNSERVFAAPVLSWKIGDRTDLSINSSYLYDRRTFDRGIVAFGSGVADIPTNRFLGERGDFRDVNQFSIGYRLEHRFNENLKIRNAFRFLDTNEVVKSATAIALDETTGELSRAYFDNANQYKIFLMQTDLISNFKTGSVNHQLLFGFDLQRNTLEGFFATPPDAFDATFVDRFTPNINIFNPIYNTRPRPGRSELVLLRDDATITDGLGIFLQDQIALTDNFKLLVGGRFDTVSQRLNDKLTDTETSQSSQAFSPRIGLVYQPIQPISLFASYSRSFVPNSGIQADGSLLDPTRGTQYEVGIRAELNQQFSATLAAYQITKTNVSTIDPDNQAFSLAIGEQRSRGIELDVSGTILPGWNVIASYSYTNAEITASNDLAVGNKITNVPRHKASLWTTYELQSGLKGLGFGFGLFYVSDRPGDLDNSFELPSYLRTDAAIYYRQNNWRAGINFQNLFNTRYFETSEIGRTTVTPGAPFTVVGSLSFTF